MILPTKSGGGVELADYMDFTFVMTSGDRGYFYFPANHPWTTLQVTGLSGKALSNKYYIGNSGWVNQDYAQHDVKGINFGFDLMSNSGYTTYLYIRLYK